MQFISPPTDSLYKFIAIAGIAVAAIAVSYPLSEIYEGMEIARNLKKSMRENEIAISEMFFPMEVNLKSNEAEIQKAIAGLDRNSPDFKEKSLKAVRLSIEFKHHLEDYDHVQVNISDAVERVFWIVIGGVIVSVFGFYLWYVRIQRYADMIIKKQALDETKKS